MALTSNGYRLQPEQTGDLAAVPDTERDDAAALRARLSEHGYLLLRGSSTRRRCSTSVATTSPSWSAAA